MFYFFCCIWHYTILQDIHFCIAHIRSTFIFLVWVVCLFVSKFSFCWIRCNVMLFYSRMFMMAPLSISCFSNADILFFNSSITRTGSPPWLVFSERSKITFPSSSNFLSTAYVKVLKLSVPFFKVFWRDIELWLEPSIFLDGLLGVSLLSLCGSGVVWMSWFSWDSGMIKVSESNTELSEVWLKGSTWI